MKVAFPKGIVNVEASSCDVRNYREDFNELELGNIDTTIELIPTVDGSYSLHNYDIEAKDMARMLSGVARLEIVKHESEGCGDCIAYIELIDLMVDDFRASRYLAEFKAHAIAHGWVFRDDDDALYYRYDD